MPEGGEGDVTGDQHGARNLPAKVEDYQVGISRKAEAATEGLNTLNALLWEIVKLFALVTAALFLYVIASGAVAGFFDFSTGALPL